MLRRIPMTQKYRTIPSGGDREDGNVVPFEMEDAHVRSNDRPIHQNRKMASVVIFFVALLVVMVGYGAHKGGGNRSPVIPTGADEAAMPNTVDGPDAEKSSQEVAEEIISGSNAGMMEASTDIHPRQIFCYGDSLTFGMVPDEKRPYPYANYLGKELDILYDFSTSPVSKMAENPLVPGTPLAVVNHLGLPGWTASEMLNHINDGKFGLCNIIHNMPQLSLVIILAGTNDIGQLSNSGKDVARGIVESIIGLHGSALACAKDAHNDIMQTVALSIPGSDFQERVPVASELSSYINNSIKEFASSPKSNGKVSYIQFPFAYKDDDLRWSKDGIHLTQEGYEELGKELAPQVKAILDGIYL